MKYIKNPIESSNGHVNECWQVVSGTFDLERDTSQLVLNGWKDAQARADGKSPDDKKTIEVVISQLGAFEPLWGELAMYLVATGGTIFQGSQLDDLPIPTWMQN